MSDLSPRERVFVLARTQNDWLTVRSTTQELQSGFAEGVDDKGRPLRWLVCPDCLADDFEHRHGCETCGGRGEIPDLGRDPMRRMAEGKAAFYGPDSQERRDRSRAIDATIVRLQLVALQREGAEPPEDWLLRQLRLKQHHDRLGDYRLLEQAQDRLGWASVSRSSLWFFAVVDGLPVSARMGRELDRIADGLADWMLGAIAAQRLGEHLAQTRLGVKRPRLRPETILVPVGVETADAAGKGRWANTASQGQRNALIAAMAAEGRTAGEISRRVGLTKRRVQQLLAGLDHVATGPAA